MVTPTMPAIVSLLAQEFELQYQPVVDLATNDILQPALAHSIVAGGGPSRTKPSACVQK
jgi:hypothetical protein